MSRYVLSEHGVMFLGSLDGELRGSAQCSFEDRMAMCARKNHMLLETIKRNDALYKDLLSVNYTDPLWVNFTKMFPRENFLPLNSEENMSFIWYSFLSPVKDEELLDSLYERCLEFYELNLHSEGRFFIEEEDSDRGFSHITFKDSHGLVGTIIESSAATRLPCIHFGVKDPKVKVMASSLNSNATGWTDVTPEGASIDSSLHLNTDQVKLLIPILQNFVDTGEVSIVTEEEDSKPKG